jgi:two-component system LytT family response regulator/two-component system response regulator LytT
MPISALIIDDEQLAREELRYLLDSELDVKVVGEGMNGIEALELIERHRPGIVFLDVQMPGMDGFAVIERLVQRSRSQKSQAGEEAAAPLPQFIFATAFDQYAVRAFEVNAADYLLKPFDRNRVHEAVERALARVEGGLALNRTAGAAVAAMRGPQAQLEALVRLLRDPRGGERAAKVVVQTQNRMLLVDQAEICFAAIEEGVIRVVTRGFEGQSRCRTLEELLEQLDPRHFWRVHRGFVVNIDHIREVVPWFKSSYQLRMSDKQQTEIPVSRAQTKRLKELFNL